MTAEPFPELMRAIESRVKSIGQALNQPLSVTGQPYDDLIVADVPRRAYCLNEGLKAFDTYAAHRQGTLYWKHWPSIERHSDRRGARYTVRMVLLISDNPVVPRLVAEAMER